MELTFTYERSQVMIKVTYQMQKWAYIFLAKGKYFSWICSQKNPAAVCPQIESEKGVFYEFNIE